MIRIRKMQREDAVRIAELERICFSSPWSEAGILDSLERRDYRMLTAEEDGVIAGYVTAYLAVDELEIANIAVDPVYRRKGIGFHLLEQLFVLARQEDVVSVYLEVRKSNDAAQALYEKLGFVSVGIRKNYYDAPKEDGIIMRYDF